MSAKSKKIVVVGDSICGKNALIITFMTNEFPKTWVPTVIENYSKTITIDEKQIELNIVATNGIEDYDPMKNEGVGEVFETLARASLPKKKKKNKCRII
ncbi:unnamed protein product, partial [Mesorhabditis belari]|uniref:Uncharacterized protein n=1 Tax=Mesorhabditis belari TaxID=2138241 RepID=A0AAF3FH58_9BILA